MHHLNDFAGDGILVEEGDSPDEGGDSKVRRPIVAVPKSPLSEPERVAEQIYLIAQRRLDDARISCADKPWLRRKHVVPEAVKRDWRGRRDVESSAASYSAARDTA